MANPFQKHNRYKGERDLFCLHSATFIARRAAATAFFASLIGFVLPGCNDASVDRSARSYAVETKADSVAHLIFENVGGELAWRSLPNIQFHFAVERGGERTPIAKHWWDRAADRYRLEWDEGGQRAVAIFSTSSREGEVFVGGDRVDPATEERLLARAYERFINDTYWMLMPTKLFDPGVRRSFEADSSDENASVIRLDFNDVGLTPGDRYWLTADAHTGALREWAFILEGDTTGVPRVYRWTGRNELQTGAGSIAVYTRKEAIGRPVVLLTDSVRVLSVLPDSMFTNL